MELKPYKQSLTHSCLAACFLILNNKPFTEIDEQEIALNGSKRTYPLYIVGVPIEASKKLNTSVNVYVDNKYFSKILKENFSNEKRIKVMYEPISVQFVKSILKSGPSICHIDDHVLGDYSHASHFIVLEKATDNFVYILDPWSGKRKKISFDTLMKGIIELKQTVKMSPLLLTIQN